MPEVKFIPLILNLYSGLFNFNSFLGLSTNLGFFNFNDFLGFCVKVGFSFAAWVCNLKLFYSIWVQEWFARALSFSPPDLKHLGRGILLFSACFISFIFLFQVVNGTFQKIQVATRQIHFLEKPCSLLSTRCCDWSSNLIFEFYTNRQQILFLNLSNLARIGDIINPLLMTSPSYLLVSCLILTDPEHEPPIELCHSLWLPRLIKSCGLFE